MKHLNKQPPTDGQLRIEYQKTAFFRMGIPFERAIQVEVVRIVLEGGAAARRRGAIKESIPKE